MKPIRLPEPPGSPTKGVPDIFEGGVYSVIRRAVVIGNGFQASENQSIGLVRALGLSEKQVLYNNSQRPGNQKSSNFDETPLWNHVTVLQKAPGGGGNRTWLCNYCQRKVTGSYSKVKAHLLKISNCGIKACPDVTPELLATLKREDNAAEVKKQQEVLKMKHKDAYISLPEGSDLSYQKRRRTNTIAEAFNVVERDAIDKAFARAFYASAVSFNLSRCPYWKKALLMLSNSNVPGYVLPRYDRLRTTLLAQEKNHIAQKLQPIKDTWRRKGVSICSDGWTDIQKKPLINIMGASSGAAMFIKSINTDGIRKDAEYVASIFLDAMEAVGAQYVVQIVTDNAANYKAAGEIIESKHPHIFWTPCVVHSINLALKSICDPQERSGHYQHCGDNFDPDGHIGEFAQLSLDEPEFEAMIFEEEEDDI